MKTFFTVSFVLISTLCFSYPKTVDKIPQFDSLLTVFESKETSDSVRIGTALKLAWLYRNVSPDNAYLYAKIAEDLSKQNQFEKYEIRAISYGGIALRNRGEYQNAMNLFMQALEKSTTIQSLEDEGYAHINIASVNIYQHNYNEAIIHLELAEVISKQLSDKRMLGYVLTNYGRVYFATELFKKAVDSFNEALDLRKKENDLYGQIVTYSDMGTVYAETGQYEEALRYLKLSLDLNQKNNEDADTMVGTLIDMARIYRNQANYDKAKELAEKAANISVNIRAKHMALNAFLELKTIERAKGRYKKALEYDDLIENYKDSIFNEEIRLKLAEINVRYLVAQREKENEILKKDQEINQIIIERHTIIMFGSFILIIILSFFIYYLYKENKNKKVINHTLHIQKSELELQSKEIHRINNLLQAKSQDIMDSINYAKGIQKAILPSWAHVKTFLPNSFVYFEPRDIVSGDFYWFKNIDNSKGILIAADCTGHGVPGGFMSMVGETALEYIVDSQKIYYPSKILEELHARLSSILRQKKSGNMDGMDVSVCLIDNKNNTVQYAGAGMSMTIVDNNKHQIIKGTSRGVGGVSTFSTCETHTFEYSSQKMFFIYSDGYADQFGGPKGKKLKSPNFRKILEACSSLPIKDQKQFMKTQFESWKQDEEQVDDVMIIGFTK
ncbi:tetratricopeptide repeat protein [Flammeovirga sp. EKP202]|uniref:tetratricopeptide repeat protein n=1 Tax=Flammeovirga sp. EKP202 TaxID=2770592 RepID=UPI00165F28DE|nr:tetratricopeptide repeat protein [Flammeovirga sp. EKP202]MBD0402087.1 tetratricopeptide repeat protein [Flammeovirga sp. EKP202]